jgi:hypothetical protein
MVGLDGKFATSCDCSRPNCLHQYVIDVYGHSIEATVFDGSEPKAFMILHDLHGVDYLFSVSKSIRASHDAAKRTLVTVGKKQWRCHSCGIRVQ